MSYPPPRAHTRNLKYTPESDECLILELMRNAISKCLEQFIRESGNGCAAVLKLIPLLDC